MNGLTALIISVSGVLFVLHIRSAEKGVAYFCFDSCYQCFLAHSQNFENSSQLPSESVNLKVILNIIFIIMLI